MNQRFRPVTAVAGLFTAATLLTGCGLIPQASPAPTQVTAEEASKNDISFKIAGDTKTAPLGIEDVAIGVDEFGGTPLDTTSPEFKEASSFAFQAYKKFRTQPWLFKKDRTPETDRKNVAQFKMMFLPSSWQETAGYFDKGQTFPVAGGNTIGTPTDETGKIDKSQLSVIDTRTPAQLTYTASTAGHFDLEGHDVIAFNIREKGEYKTLQGTATVAVAAKIYVTKADGKWLVTGLQYGIGKQEGNFYISK